MAGNRNIGGTFGTRLSSGVLALLASLTMGCAGTLPGAAAGAKTEQIVKERAETRWGALMKRDLETAYEFLSPASKTVLPKERYLKVTRTLEWKTARVTSLKCESDRCEVGLMIRVEGPRVGSVETFVPEVWIKDGGTWWYVYKG